MTPFSAEVHFHKNPLGSLPVAYKKHAMMFSREPLGPFTKINFLLLFLPNCNAKAENENAETSESPTTESSEQISLYQRRLPRETTEKITNIITVHRINSVVECRITYMILYLKSI